LLDRIQYITYKFENQKINTKPKNLSPEQSAILDALDIKL